MARRPLLALLRGADGRSIGRALALLLLVNALVAGLHTGALAASGDAPGVFCSLAQPAGGGGTPLAPNRESPCCFAGCVMAAPGLPSAAVAIVPPAAIVIGRVAGAVWAEPASLRFRVHRARGPPSLA